MPAISGPMPAGSPTVIATRGFIDDRIAQSRRVTAMRDRAGDSSVLDLRRPTHSATSLGPALRSSAVRAAVDGREGARGPPARAAGRASRSTVSATSPLASMRRSAPACTTAQVAGRATTPRAARRPAPGACSSGLPMTSLATASRAPTSRSAGGRQQPRRARRATSSGRPIRGPAPRRRCRRRAAPPGGRRRRRAVVAHEQPHQVVGRQPAERQPHRARAHRARAARRAPPRSARTSCRAAAPRAT